MAVLDADEGNWGGYYWFYCPGCKSRHMVVSRKDRKQPSWDFNGNLERPTFSPSLLVTYNGDQNPSEEIMAEIIASGATIPPAVCHSFVRDGQIQYLSDCTHELAGKTVPLPDMESI